MHISLGNGSVECSKWQMYLLFALQITADCILTLLCLCLQNLDDGESRCASSTFWLRVQCLNHTGLVLHTNSRSPSETIATGNKGMYVYALFALFTAFTYADWLTWTSTYLLIKDHDVSLGKKKWHWNCTPMIDHKNLATEVSCSCSSCLFVSTSTPCTLDIVLDWRASHLPLKSKWDLAGVFVDWIEGLMQGRKELCLGLIVWFAVCKITRRPW